MSVDKNYSGAWVISAVISGYLVTRQYYFHTKREAIRSFKAEFPQIGEWERERTNR